MEMENYHLYLADSQEQLKEVRARQKALEDQMLKMTGTLEKLKVELPVEAIVEYKKSAGFEMGLVRIGQVSYEYGYWVALARFKAQDPDLETEEDPFAIPPEDKTIPMVTEQPFDDSPLPPKGVVSL
ncbi:hypothetical protein GW17_00057130 [Ensete ventricosum]|nr:hypothetical protein GW17_00057130 [Ensete ventricosum]